jgi:oligoendopeptidase F
MEMLTMPYLARLHGGYYSEAGARQAGIEQLERGVRFLPYMAVVDAFQDWVYTEAPEEVSAAQLDAQWSALWDRYMQGVDYRGLEVEKATGWHRKLHIFQIPFYYVEYGLAQLGAWQVWRNSLADYAGAVAAYRRALGLGHTCSLPELYAAAGAAFTFDGGEIGELMALIERQLAALRA